MLTNIKAFIFDLDGTLADSMWVWVSIDEDYIKKYHLTVPSDFHEAMEGMSYTETAEYFLRIFPELPHTVEEIKQEWYEMAIDKYANEVPLKSGAKELIQWALKQGIKLGIATSNDRGLVERFLEAHDLLDSFQAITTSCEVHAGKPAPDVYLNVSEKLQISPEHCLVFEDVPMGILAGKNANMHVCAVDDAFSRVQEVKKRELADYYISDYHDIINQTYEVL